MGSDKQMLRCSLDEALLKLDSIVVSGFKYQYYYNERGTDRAVFIVTEDSINMIYNLSTTEHFYENGKNIFSCSVSRGVITPSTELFIV